MEKVICIVGPTASSKTKVSIELAKKINGEIISADSMQIYKVLKVGTAKVTKEEMQNIPHHLIDFVEVEDEFSVAEFKELCIEKIEDIISRGKTPILVGGTGLYFSAVINDLTFEKEEVNEELRQKLYIYAEQYGNKYVHDILEKVDYQASLEIHPNNLKRVIRAIEIASTGVTKTEKVKEDKLKKNTKFNFQIFCLKWEKDILNERINQRVDIMLDQGLEAEAKLVSKFKYGTLRQAIGYKEFSKYFYGELSYEETVELIKLRSRQYAKRQMTWFKKMENVNYIDMNNDINNIVVDIMEKSYEKEEGK